jgi:hypothetical protein
VIIKTNHMRQHLLIVILLCVLFYCTTSERVHNGQTISHSTPDHTIPHHKQHEGGSRRIQVDTVVLSAIPAAGTRIDNCFPFGSGTVTSGGFWQPYYVSVYKNLPATQLLPGDKLAFDIQNPNDVVPNFSIAFGHTDTNGGATVDVKGFTQVVTEQAAPSAGDTIVGNYELVFTLGQAYNFPGGGLMIRFHVGDPNSPFASDSTCVSAFTGTDAPDSSGLFVEREYRVDANAHGGASDGGFIPAFKITRSVTGTCLTRTCTGSQQCCRFYQPGKTTPVEQCYTSFYSCIQDTADSSKRCLCKTGNGCCNQVCFDSARYSCVHDQYASSTKPYALCSSTNQACNKVCYDPTKYSCNVSGKIVKI